MFEPGNIAESRTAERRPTDAPSTMRAEGGTPVDVVVLDISRSGIRIQTEADLGIGQEISIGLAGAGVTRAYVAWARRDEYGCAFERPMAPEDEAAAFSSAPVKRLGRASVEPNNAGDDYLRELYLRHRVWALPWDALLMTAAIGLLLWALFRL